MATVNRVTFIPNIYISAKAISELRDDTEAYVSIIFSVLHAFLLYGRKHAFDVMMKAPLSQDLKEDTIKQILDDIEMSFKNRYSDIRSIHLVTVTGGTRHKIFKITIHHEDSNESK